VTVGWKPYLMGRSEVLSFGVQAITTSVRTDKNGAKKCKIWGARIALPRAMSEGRVDFPTISANIFEVDPTPLKGAREPSPGFTLGLILYYGTP
jgi:hypothetical protein